MNVADFEKRIRQKKNVTVRVFLSLVLFFIYIGKVIQYLWLLTFSHPVVTFSTVYPVTQRGYRFSYTQHYSFVRQLRLALASSAVVAVIVSVMVGSLSAPQPVIATAVACPVTDGGVGDGDSTVNGTIQISASTTWTMSGGTAGDYWNCGAVNLLVTNNSTLTFAGDLTTGAYPRLAVANLQIDNGSSISGDAKGCTAPTTAGNGKGPSSTTNICTASTTGYSTGSTTQANTRTTGGAGAFNGGSGGAGAGGVAYNGSGGSTWTSSSHPVFFGSSAGTLYATSSTYRIGGTGGGAIYLDVAGTLTFNGGITANGETGNLATGSGGVSTGGGSAGCIYVEADTITGTTGTISALGGTGAAGTVNGGGGGGGCVYINYLTNTSSFISGLTASTVVSGGTGPGTAVDGSVGTLSVVNLSAPVATTPASITQATDATGQVTFSTSITDVNSVSRLKVEYSDDGGTTWKDPYLISATPSAGTIDLDNANEYQIGTVNGIDTDTSAVTVTVGWNTQNAANDGGAGGVSGYQTDIQVRVTPYDGTNLGVTKTASNFNVDNLVPASLASLTAGTTGIGVIPLTWTAATDDNFGHYELWYGASQSDVQNRTGAALEWDDSDDTALTTATTASTSITGISLTGTVYVKIWAIDTYGNSTTVTDVSASMTALSNWSSYQEVVINNSAGSALTNYQVLINVTNITNIDSNCNDIRVLNFDQKSQVDFWVERCDIAGGDVRIYAELPTISAATTDSIFVYYNNATLDTSASNCAATFLDCVDENDVASFSSPWNSASYGAFNVLESTGGYLHFQRTSGSYKDAAITLNSAVDTVTDVVVESRFKHNSPSTNTDGRAPIVLDSSNGAYGKVFTHPIFPLNGNQDSFGYYNGVYNALGDTAFAFDTNFISVFNIKRSTSKVDYYVYNDSRVSLASAVDSTWGAGAPTAINKLAVVAHTSNKLADIYLDYVIFRKYAATPPTVSISGWYNANWAYRIKITTDNTKVSGTSDLTDYPVLLDLSNLPVDFFSNVKADGSDIVVTSSNGTTKLPRELEVIDTSARTGTLWFRAPTLGATTDTDFYIYYGNNGATETNSAVTWPIAFEGVYHMTENPAGVAPQVQDSGIHNSDATSAGSMTSDDVVVGKINKGYALDGTGDSFKYSGFTESSMEGMSAWFKPDADINTASSCVGFAGTDFVVSGTNESIGLGACTTLDTNEVITVWRNANSTNSRTMVKSITISGGAWHHLVVYWDSTNSRYQVILDGVAQTMSSYSGHSAKFTTTAYISFGQVTNGTSTFPGVMDEGRMWSTTRTADSLVTEYNNTNNPGTFFANFGTQVGVSGLPATPTITTPTEAATGQSRTITLNTSAYTGSEQAHTLTSWQVATDSGFSNLVWTSLNDSANLTSIVVDNSPGSFQGTHASQAQLGPGTYYVRARHTNSVGSSNYSSPVSFSTINTAPTVGSLTASQKTDGSGTVDVSFAVDDADDDFLVSGKIELNTGSGWFDPAIDETDANTTAGQGDPKVENDNAYQVGNSNGFITTVAGANTVNIDLSPSNFTAIDSSTVQFRITPNDSVADGTVVTSGNFIADRVTPTTPSSLVNNASTLSTATLTWTTGSESHFNHYEIWYGTNATDVTNRTGTAVEWDNTDDGALTILSTATTTITGLTASTTYYVKICAVDNYGNESCTTNGTLATTNAPTASSVSCSQRTDGSNDVVVSSTVNDADLTDPVQIKLEASLDGGSTWSVADPTVSTTNSDTTATYGDPGVDNAATYQIGIAGAYIVTTAPNTVSTVWKAGIDVAGTTDIANGRVRVTPYDGTNAGAAASSASCVIDVVAPTAPGSLAASTTSNAITPTWTASTETNFNHYEIWYGTNAADVTNRTGTAVEWDNADDGALATRTTTTTSITGLSATTTYYLKICAVDNYGHETCSSSNLTAATGTPPTVSGVSAAQKTDGSNVVDLQFVIDDANDNDQVMARVEVNTGSGWTNATLAPLDTLTTAEWGDPKINNSQTFNGSTYQVGTAAGYILTSSGENRVHVDLTSANFTGVNSSTVQVRVTANDQGSDGTTVTSANFIVDTTNPTIPGSLTKVTTERGDWATLTWTVSTETNFDHYEIWHGVSESAVQNRTANEFDDIPDEPLLAVIGTTTATLTNLTAGLGYFAMICAVDDYGHDACSASISFTANTPPSVSNISLTPAQDGTGLMAVAFTISDNENATGINAVVEYNLQDGNGWKKATLTSTVTNTAGTTPSIDNTAAFPVRGITGPSTGNALGVQWNSRTDVGTTTVSSTLMRVRTADSIDSATTQATSGVIVDTAAPTGLGGFQERSYTSSQMALQWNAVSESNFSRYEVWFGTNQNDVNNRTGSAQRWDNGNDSSLATTATANTTITGLSANTTYYFKLFAKDQYLNEASVDAFSYKTNALPSVSSLAETHRRAGDGYITVDVVVSESDTSDTLSGAVQYNVGQGWRNATIYLMSGSGVTLDNTATKQLGNIAVTSGSRTIQVLWDSKADLPTTEVSTAQLRFVPYDQIESGTITTITNALVDNVAPSGLANVAKRSSTSSEIALQWTPTSTEPYFDHYEVWYGTNQSSVENRTGSATEWDADNDTALAQASTTATTISGLSSQTVQGASISATPTYYFKVFAVDQAGNETGSSTVSASPVANDANGDGTNDTSTGETAVYPTFSGTLPNISFYSGDTTTTVFDLDDYFSHAQSLPLTYSVTGQHYLTVNITNGAVQFTAPATFSGTETLTFYAVDSNNRSAASNSVVVTVTEATEDDTDNDDTGDDQNDQNNNTNDNTNESEDTNTEQVDHVTGTNRGQGIIRVIGTEGSVLAQWQAFDRGGVIPRLVTVKGNEYVFAVKVRSGSTLHIFTTAGELVTKKRLSPKLHWRKLAVGELDGNVASEEIVVATRRDNKYYLKLYQFRSGQRSLRLQKRSIFTDVKSNKYSITVQNSQVQLKKSNGMTVQRWRPY